MAVKKKLLTFIFVVSPSFAGGDFLVDAEKKTAHIAEVTKLSAVTGASATRLNMYLVMSCDKPVTQDVLDVAMSTDRYNALVQVMAKNKTLGMNGTKKILMGIEKEVGCVNR